MIIQESMNLEQKLSILADAAKYDVACTSSGVERAGEKGSIGNAVASGICHTFASDGRCISLLKILFTNECVFDCKYCINRSSNDIPRTTFTPEEVCKLTIEFYRRNYIEGLFLSSGVIHSPDYTMNLIVQTLRMLRTDYHFQGYIHCKAIPGASPDLIEYAGWYADRMSVNLELPTAEGLKRLAPHKNRNSILKPIRQIQSGILQSQMQLGMTGGNKGAYWHTRRKLEGKTTSEKMLEDTALFLCDERKHQNDTKHSLNNSTLINQNSHNRISNTNGADSTGLSRFKEFSGKRGFVSAGQSTQMLVGAAGENDYELVSVAEAMYKHFDMKRVFYSAFIRVNEDDSLPTLPGGPPLLREHRLYQADWLMRYYGFNAGELLSEERPNFNVLLDPKCHWAIGHLEQFPIEVSKADYYLLLRVPGIGPKSASRIVSARKSGRLSFDNLKKMGVVLRRALYFITCYGQMMYQTKIEENYIISHLLETKERLPKYLNDLELNYQQISLFDVHLGGNRIEGFQGISM